VSDALFDEFRSFIEAEVTRRRVPGVAVGVLHDGIEHTAAFGVTNVDNPLPVDEDTLFQVGSISKTFTATAALRLVDEGRLDIDRPVQAYLPDLRLKDPGVAATVTSRHLLTHTAGWVGDHFSDTGRGDDALARYVGELADLDQLTPVGTVYSYCNSGFSLLGRVIEVLTGETFEAALKRLVLAPLGLERSFLFPEQVMTHRYAVGHAGIAAGKPRVLQPWQLPRSAVPAGGLIASVKDQLRYARLQLGDGTGVNGERVLAPETLKAMRQPLVPATGLPERTVGLAWHIGTNNISHGGGTYGQSTFLLICPDHGGALSVLTNAFVGAEVAGAAVKWFLEHWTGFTPPQSTAVPVAGDVLDACVGLYRGTTNDVELGRLGDALVARSVSKGGFPTRDTPPLPEPPPLIRLGFYAEDRLVGLDPGSDDIRAEVLRGPDGAVAWLRFGSRIHRRVREPVR
jgi:CubicO group peptidase (beta-lactamase class C family)